MTTTATYIALDLRSATFDFADLAERRDSLPLTIWLALRDADGLPSEVQAWLLTPTLYTHIRRKADALEAKHARGELSQDALERVTTRLSRIVDAANRELDREAVLNAWRLSVNDPDAFAGMLADATPEMAIDIRTPPRDPFSDPTVPTVDHADLVERDAALAYWRAINAAIDARPVVVAEKRATKKGKKAATAPDTLLEAAQ